MKRGILIIALLAKISVFSESDNPMQGVVNMNGWIGRATGSLTVIANGKIDFGNLKRYNGEYIKIEEHIILKDTGLAVGEKAPIKLTLPQEAELTNGSTVLRVIPSFRMEEDMHMWSVEITGKQDEENSIDFPIYARILGAKEIITTGVYSGSFSIKAEYLD